MFNVAEYFPGMNPDFSSLAEKPKDDDEDSKEKKEKKGDRKVKRPSIFERDKELEKNDDDKAEKKLKEPALDKLDAEEKKLVANEYVDARVNDVREELAGTEENSPDEAAALANATLLETINEKLDENDAATDELLDDAVAETIAELELEQNTEENEASEDPENTESEPATENEATEIDDEEDDASAVLPTVSTPTTPTPASTSPINATIPPPVPPIPPLTPLGTPTPSGGGGGGAFVPPIGTFPGTSPNSSSGNVRPNTVTERVVEKGPVGRYLLVGGIIGYLVGKRSGRIKTEKKLIPIQHKLEKEVIDLQQKIALREEKIRKLAYEQVAEKPEKQLKIIERIEKRQEQKSKKLEKEVINPRSEQIGKFALTTERPRHTETNLKQEVSIPVELMTVAELLSVAEKVPAEGTNVKKLYETNQVDQQGLRRLIRAYMRGEKLDNILKDNLRIPEEFYAPETLSKTAPEKVPSDFGGPSESQPGATNKLDQLINNASKNIQTSSGLHIFDEPKKPIQKKSLQPAFTTLVIAITLIVILMILL